MEDPKYPIGKFAKPERIDAAMREQFIREIAAAPTALRAAVAGLDDRKLDTAYRDGGWTVRQVVHHLPDSHMNAYVRLKLALTESEPVIKPYAEDRWAELPDAKHAPVDSSLALLESIHFRWIACMREMKAEDFEKKFRHPERGLMSLNDMLALYAWHGKHHVAHIRSLRKKMGW